MVLSALKLNVSHSDYNSRLAIGIANDVQFLQTDILPAWQTMSADQRTLNQKKFNQFIEKLQDGYIEWFDSQSEVMQVRIGEFDADKYPDTTPEQRVVKVSEFSKYIKQAITLAQGSEIFQRMQPTTRESRADVENGIKEFLLTISKRYISAMRDATPGLALWGGDIELIELAKLYHVKICVHMLQSNKPPIGVADAPEVHLWYTGHHYEVYDPYTINHIRQPNVPGDGNCLFQAFLRAHHLLINPGDLVKTFSQDEIAALRGRVCDALLEIIGAIERRDAQTIDNVATTLNAEHDPILIRFQAVVLADDPLQAQHALQYLPFSEFRSTAFEWYQRLQRATVMPAVAVESSMEPEPKRLTDTETMATDSFDSVDEAAADIVMVERSVLKRSSISLPTILESGWRRITEDDIEITEKPKVARSTGKRRRF